ncbi:hypothetical protein [Flammeovirga sp. EKP202]|uniref:hypothetical protein n=1 Tax=Flammeovirga sp. EKP202 TaxID=2770592 RepID=UPI00165F0403|nr:hypothetical protein [Flammeovirga sp. EKP202]
MPYLIILLMLLLSNSLFAQSQKVSTSYKTIYLIEDEGLLDKCDVEERNIITLTHSMEEWQFFFEKNKLIAFECIQKDFLFEELFEVKPNVFEDKSGLYKLYTQIKKPNEISITIESQNNLTDLHFCENNNEEATFYFKKMVVNKSKL